MAAQTSDTWQVDGPTFTALQACIPQLHAILEWVLRPPRSEEQVETFARLFPVVEKIEALIATIVKGRVPEAGVYLEAIETAVREIQEKITAGVMTSAEAQRFLAELDDRREQMMARALALARAEEKTSQAGGKEV